MTLEVAWDGHAVVGTAAAVQQVGTAPVTRYRGVARSAMWAPGADRWHVVRSPKSLLSSIRSTATWTGTQFFFLGGTCPVTDSDAHCPQHRGHRATTFNPQTSTVTTLPRFFIATGVGAWTGRAILLVTRQTGKATAYDPAARRWRRLPATLPFDTGVTSIWTGHEFIVWGGIYRTTAIPGRALVGG